MPHIRSLAASVVVAALLAGCGPSGSKTPAASAGSNGAGKAALHGTITVFAASSLTEAFETLGKKFEAEHPGVRVRFNFGASSALALQINQGAPADVFASAAVKNMQQVAAAGNATRPVTFVKNVMEIATPASNPARIASLADLARPGVKVALCQPQVPCGATAQRVFRNARVTVKPVTLEADVKSTLSKVELDEVDAGVVYVTDVRAARAKVVGIAIPAGVNASTAYPIAALSHATNSAGASAFVDFVLSAEGQQVLVADGFEKP